MVDEGDTMVSFQPAVGGLTKCVVAVCLSFLCVSNNRRQRRSGSCLCRGPDVSVSVKDLSDRIIADWQLGKVDNNHLEFEDLIFALPVTCVPCNKFISKEVKALVD